MPAAAEQISLGGDLQLDAGQDLHPGRNKFAWVRVAEGQALLMGDPELRSDSGGSYLPLGSGMWLTAADTLKLKALTTEEIVADGKWLPSLWVCIRCFSNA